MRSIVRRDTGESYQAFLTRLAKASGIETPTREDLARLDRKRKKKTSNKDWTNPSRSRCEGHEDEGRPDASGPQSRACGRPGDRRDCRGHAAGRRRKATRRRSSRRRRPRPSRSKTRRPTSTEPQALEEIIADKGYHSNQTMVDLDAVGIRSYIAEPDRGRRDWSKEPEAQAPVYRQSSPDSRTTRPAPDAPTRRDGSNARSRISMTRAACVARICAVTRTS